MWVLWVLDTPSRQTAPPCDLRERRPGPSECFRWFRPPRPLPLPQPCECACSGFAGIGHKHCTRDKPDDIVQYCMSACAGILKRATYLAAIATTGTIPSTTIVSFQHT